MSLSEKTLLARFLEEASPQLKDAFWMSLADRAFRGYYPYILRKALSGTAHDLHGRAMFWERGFPPLASVWGLSEAGEELKRDERFLSEEDKNMHQATARLRALAHTATRNPEIAAVYLRTLAALSGGGQEEGKRLLERERSLQELWIRSHGGPSFFLPPITRDTLAAVDAYIADGLLLED